MTKIYFLSLLYLVTNLACLAQSSPYFEDITAASGIDFQYTFGDDSYENIMESSGSGVSILDYNNDGYYDIFLLNGTYLEGISKSDGQANINASNVLYRNNGNGTFTDVTAQTGLRNTQWSMAAGINDYDHDGDEDILLANYGPNVFYRNNGDGTYTDITTKLGLQGPLKLNGFPTWSVSVAFLDFNNDGRTDIMVGNFLAFDPEIKYTPDPSMMPHPDQYLGQASLLYEQRADGTFEDVTKSMKLYYPDSKCMGITVFDVDNDGDVDIFQSNDHQSNFLFKNQNQFFQEIAASSGVAVNNDGKPTGSMHATLGDIDNDGKIDILVTDLKYGSLYRNIGAGIFKDVTQSSGVASSLKGKGGWAAALTDFDNDGDLDLFSANGTAEELILQPALLLQNDGKGRFENANKTSGSYFQKKHSGRGGAVLDFDNDGDLDIIVSHVEPGSPATLLENRTDNQNHWVGLQLKTSDGVSLAGTKAILTYADKKQIRIYQPSTGYLSYSDPRLHFGLGAEHQIKEIKIEWTDGTTQILKNVKSDRYISVVKKTGK